MIPLRAEVISNLVQGAQMLVANYVNGQLSEKVNLKHPPAVDMSITQRAGVDKQTEYERPFWTAVQAARSGKADPMALGSRRLRNMAGTDLQMAKIRQAQQVLKAAGRKVFHRVVTSGNPCALCEIAETQTYYTEDLMPIHDNCSCEVEPDEATADISPQSLVAGGDQNELMTQLADEDASDEAYRNAIAVRNHGEVGPMLTWSHQKFLGPKDLPEKPKVVATRTGAAESGPGAPKEPKKYDVRSSDYGMTYRPEGEKIVERARDMPEKAWEKLPVETLPAKTPLIANEEMLRSKPINKVVSGEQPFREGYVTKLWREPNGDLHVVDGHHRVAMYNALGKDMPVRIMDESHLPPVRATEGVPKSIAAQAESRLAESTQKAREVVGKARTQAEYLARLEPAGPVRALSEFLPVPLDEVEKWPVRSELAGREDTLKQVYAAIDDKFRRAAAAEPEISAALQQAIAPLGRLERFDSRLKEESSLFRKTQDEMIDERLPIDEAVAKIRDSVRYTAVVPDEGYWEAGNKLRDELERNGFRANKQTQGWYEKGYRGRNDTFISPNGTEFEIQIHTESSLATSEINHTNYNIERDTSGQYADAEKIAARDRQQPLWDAVHIPDGTPILDSVKSRKMIGLASLDDPVGRRVQQAYEKATR